MVPNKLGTSIPISNLKIRLEQYLFKENFNMLKSIYPKITRVVQLLDVVRL